jgi:hypothetical protein
VLSTAPRLLNLASLSSLASVHGVIGNAGRLARFATLPDFARVACSRSLFFARRFHSLALAITLGRLETLLYCGGPLRWRGLTCPAILRGLPVLLLLAPLAEPLATLFALFFPEWAGSWVLPIWALDAPAPFI